MTKRNYPLRLQPSLMEEARMAAESQGVALNQLFNVAVAEKLSALRTEKVFQERIRRAERPETPPVPDRAENENSPMEDDELPPYFAPDTEEPAKIAEPPGRATPQFGKPKRRMERLVWR